MTMDTEVSIRSSLGNEKHASVESIHVLACSHVLAFFCLAQKNRQNMENNLRTTRELEKNTRIASTLENRAALSKISKNLVREKRIQYFTA